MLWSDPVPPERDATPETDKQLDDQGFGSPQPLTKTNI
jgi:hypothetical protein